MRTCACSRTASLLLTTFALVCSGSSLAASRATRDVKEKERAKPVQEDNVVEDRGGATLLERADALKPETKEPSTWSKLTTTNVPELLLVKAAQALGAGPKTLAGLAKFKAVVGAGRGANRSGGLQTGIGRVMDTDGREYSQHDGEEIKQTDVGENKHSVSNGAQTTGRSLFGAGNPYAPARPDVALVSARNSIHQGYEAEKAAKHATDTARQVQEVQQAARRER
jgi:hypothetical protein